ncbi:isoleucine--tRNA ligase, mitochondrial [Anopheles cruzii]|uniref:isoleucine--tRNA ligase, mitochondrial n=1 Tax=Anopheles cruzii TaxID=68878 RepID=UPI0022EC7E84|nr:isoleucine--tRNA ligase, mitochondrial [Anopheles cruzii]
MLQNRYGFPRLATGFRSTGRYFATKNVAKEEIKYTNTINLPKTKFPTRLSAAKRSDVEERLRRKCFSELYAWNLSALPVENEFVLHDGPPYANGDLHMGHAVNKILKDLILKHKIISGTRVHYVPGWDCHGLPIELKALNAFGSKGKHSSEEYHRSAPEIRDNARRFALETINRQRDAFESWSVTAAWNQAGTGFYRTLDPTYIREQLRLFYELHERNLIYRDLKPVYWSPSSRSALAEAELEYDEDHVSPSMYLKLRLVDRGTNCHGIDRTALPNAEVYAVIWTTTPWTLPANQAICYNPSLEYCLVRSAAGEILLVGKDLVAYLSEQLGQHFEVLQTVSRSELGSLRYHHPLNNDELLPFLPAAHVKAEKGTGLVHTAPAHGPDDFLVCLEHQIPVKSLIDENGCYNDRAPASLVGSFALTEGNRIVTEELGDATLKLASIEHSYPIDWRTKQPVMLRASNQWFIDTNSLKQSALEAVRDVEIFPRTSADVSKRVLEGQLRKRPYWCISRQRAWGVPIPVLYDVRTKNPIVHRSLLAAIETRLMKDSSIDFWWTTPASELVSEELLKDLPVETTREHLVKGNDILDIWFDSGVSWRTVLGRDRVADLYLEGIDQFTGWFQSSLLTSVADRGHAPYKAIFVHGFAVDENGLKMSKSLGNIISPADIITQYGCDTLRWWVCAHAIQNTSIPVSHKLLASSGESIQKLRGILKFLLGVVAPGGVPLEKDERHVLQCDMHIDRYYVQQLNDFHRTVFELYDSYQHNRATATILNFCLSTLSGLYLHVIKDRLYCGTEEEHAHVATILTHTYRTLCQVLWPIVPFLVEESWTFFGTDHFYRCCASLTSALSPPVDCDQSTAIIERALMLRHAVYQQAQLNVNTWLLQLTVECTDDEDYRLLSAIHPTEGRPDSTTELCELLQVASVELLPRRRENTTESIERFAVTVTKSDQSLCPRCRRHLQRDSHDPSCVCERCDAVLRSQRFAGNS